MNDCWGNNRYQVKEDTPKNHIVLLCFCEILEGAGKVAEDSGWGGDDGFVTVLHTVHLKE